LVIVDRVLPVGVIASPLLIVAEHLVRLADNDELLVGVRVIWMLIGVAGPAQLIVGFADGRRICVDIYPQHLVVGGVRRLPRRHYRRSVGQ